MNWQNYLARIGEELTVFASQSRVVEAFWLTAGLLLVLLLRRPVLRGVCRLVGLDDASVEQQVVHRIDVPLQLLILALAVMPFTGLVHGLTGQIVQLICRMLVPALVAHIAIQSLDLALFRWFIKHRTSYEVAPVFRFVILAALYLATALVVLNWGFGIDVLPLLATSTVVTAVLGLSLQDTLRNVFSGISITMEKGFRPGDWIRFKVDPGGEQIGQLVEIGWRSTRVRTAADGIVIIPNGLFSASSVLNYSSSGVGLMVELNVPVADDVSPETVQSALLESVKTVEGVSDSRPCQVNAVVFRKDCVEFLVRFPVDDFEKREEVTTAVVGAVWKALEKLNALPVRTAGS